jgi:hypothetical protein
MDIAPLSMVMSQSIVQSSAGIAVMKIAILAGKCCPDDRNDE